MRWEGFKNANQCAKEGVFGTLTLSLDFGRFWFLEAFIYFFIYSFFRAILQLCIVYHATIYSNFPMDYVMG